MVELGFEVTEVLSWDLKSWPFVPKLLAPSVLPFMEKGTQQFCSSPLLKLPLSVCERICLQNYWKHLKSTDWFLVIIVFSIAISIVLYMK